MLDLELTRDDVLAIRLYTGPAYQPINAFLRQLGKLDDSFRFELARHPGFSFSRTVSHIIRAIRIMSDCAMPADCAKPLYRNVRGKLPVQFWIPDQHNRVCATEFGFVSTASNLDAALRYMGQADDNVLFKVYPSMQTSEGFHMGADVSMLSQFSHETEVLFPPSTLLVVRNNSASESAIAEKVDHIRRRSRSSVSTQPNVPQSFRVEVADAEQGADTASPRTIRRLASLWRAANGAEKARKESPPRASRGLSRQATTRLSTFAAIAKEKARRTFAAPDEATRNVEMGNRARAIMDGMVEEVGAFLDVQMVTEPGKRSYTRVGVLPTFI